MNIKDVLKPQFILFDEHFETKEEAIKAMIALLAKEGVVTDATAFEQAVYAREQQSPTGLENGLAIPHGQDASVLEPTVVFARLKKPIKDWESIDPNNQVDMIFMIAIPKTNEDNIHLQVLSQLSRALGSKKEVERLRTVNAYETFVSFFNQEKEVTSTKESRGYLLAVTACSTGIAHTYMAATSLEEAANELGYSIKVEKQGASGIEDRITKEDVQKAEGVIFAVDVAVKEKERFNGLKVVQVKVAEPLHDAKKVIQQLISSKQIVNEAVTLEDSVSQKGRFYQALMNGISYMIPVLVAGGLLVGIAKLIAMGFGVTQIIISADLMAQQTSRWMWLLYHMDKFGSLLLTYIYPIFGMFAAYSIADRPGLVPGFAAGMLAGGLHIGPLGLKGAVPSGFIGAIILAFLAGFVADWINKNLKVSKNLSAIKPMLIIPGVTLLIVFLASYFFVEPVFGWVNFQMQEFIRRSQDVGKYGLSALIAGLTAFDLGGPINKAAGAVAIPLAAEGVFPLTPRVLAIVIPPIGLGLATVIDRFVVRRRVFSDELRVTGSTSLVLGFIAVSEGAIPFMLKNPLITIPINIIGAILGSWTAIYFGAVQWLPLPAIWGWPLATNVGAYVLGVVVGVLFIAFANIFVRYMIIKKQEAR